jgi:hypothetical protein
VERGGYRRALDGLSVANELVIKKSNFNALHSVIRYILISHNASVPRSNVIAFHYKINGFTVLHRACRSRSFCQKAIIKVQFSQGANLSKLVFGEWTSFHLASYHNQTSPLIFWTRYGGDYRETPAFPPTTSDQPSIKEIDLPCAFCNRPVQRSAHTCVHQEAYIPWGRHRPDERVHCLHRPCF